MNGVDVADQQRAAYHYDRRCHRTWQPLFHWLREMVLVNCTVLYKKSGKIGGSRNDASLYYRRELSLQLMRLTRDHYYINQCYLRKRKRFELEVASSQDPCDIPECPEAPQLMRQRRYCKACASLSRKTSGDKKRTPLGELSPNSLQGRRIEDKASRLRPPLVTHGCPNCNLNFCRKAECWDHHREKFL